jgi:hypothetical protein
VHRDGKHQFARNQVGASAETIRLNRLLGQVLGARDGQADRLAAEAFVHHIHADRPEYAAAINSPLCRLSAT